MRWVSNGPTEGWNRSKRSAGRHVAKQHRPEDADTIVTCVKAFANYGFPESHAYKIRATCLASVFHRHYRRVLDGDVQ